MRRAYVWKWKKQRDQPWADSYWGVDIVRPNGLPHPDYPYHERFPTHAEALAWAIEQVEEKEKDR